MNITQRSLGEEHIETGVIYKNFGIIFERMKDYKEAEKYFRKAIKIFHNIRGEEHPETGNCYNSIALVYKELGNLKDSFKYF